MIRPTDGQDHHLIAPKTQASVQCLSQDRPHAKLSNETLFNGPSNSVPLGTMVVTQRLILTLLVAALVAIAFPAQSGTQGYKETQKYIGSMGSGAPTQFCSFLGVQVSDLTPYDCFGGAEFRDFNEQGEYRITINDAIADPVGAAWMFCYEEACPAEAHGFCDSTIVLAAPGVSIHVSFFPLDTVLCDGIIPPVEGTITMEIIS